MLTEDQVNHFHSQGYLVLENAIAKADIERLKTAALTIVDNFDTVQDNSPWPGNDEAIAVEVPLGSVVIFHDHMPHYSSQNLSQHSRHAFTLHVAEKSSRWSEKNWLQRPALGDFEL